jgi:hypothetical protein
MFETESLSNSQQQLYASLATESMQKGRASVFGYDAIHQCDNSQSNPSDYTIVLISQQNWFFEGAPPSLRILVIRGSQRHSFERIVMQTFPSSHSSKAT